MLDLLVYCYLVLSLRYPHHVTAVADLADHARLQCLGFVVSLFGGREPALVVPFDFWTPRNVECVLDQLDAYVGSMA